MVKQPLASVPTEVFALTPHSANSSVLPKSSSIHIPGAIASKCAISMVARSLGTSGVLGERADERTAPHSTASLVMAEQSTSSVTNSYRAMTLLGEPIDATGWRVVKNSSTSSSERSYESRIVHQPGSEQQPPEGAQPKFKTSSLRASSQAIESEPVRTRDIRFTVHQEPSEEDDSVESEDDESGEITNSSGRRVGAEDYSRDFQSVSQKSSIASRQSRQIGQAVRFVGSSSSQGIMRSIEAVHAQNPRFFQEAGERSKVFDSNQWIHKMESAEVLYNRRRAPKFIGPYVMGDVLGEGSYGKVREGFCSITLKRVAVKIMKRKKLRKIPNGESNVKRELSLLRRLRHKNIITLIDVLYNNEKQKMYMVLEYCAGMLQEILDRADGNKLPISQVHSYFKQLMEGVYHLHNNCIVHRDIKPHNLLILRDGTLKISDFGVAEELSLYDNSDVCTTSSGTPAFQPPEIATGKEQFSGTKCDIWSCGVTLYNMISGKYPFEGENIYALFESIAKAEYNMPEEADRQLSDLIRGMLDKDIANRVTAEKVLMHPWVVTPQIRSENEVPVSGSADELAETEGVSEFKIADTTLIPYLDEMFANEEIMEHVVPEDQEDYYEEEEESPREPFESPINASPMSLPSVPYDAKDSSPRRSKWTSFGISFGSSLGNDTGSFLSSRSDRPSIFRSVRSPARSPAKSSALRSAIQESGPGREFNTPIDLRSPRSPDSVQRDRSENYYENASPQSPAVRRSNERPKNCLIM